MSSCLGLVMDCPRPRRRGCSAAPATPAPIGPHPRSYANKALALTQTPGATCLPVAPFVDFRRMRLMAGSAADVVQKPQMSRRSPVSMGAGVRAPLAVFTHRTKSFNALRTSAQRGLGPSPASSSKSARARLRRSSAKEGGMKSRRSSQSENSGCPRRTPSVGVDRSLSASCAAISACSSA